MRRRQFYCALVGLHMEPLRASFVCLHVSPPRLRHVGVIHVYNPDVGSRADIVGEPRIYEGMYLVEVPYAKTTWICIAWRLFVWMVTAGLCVFGHG